MPSLLLGQDEADAVANDSVTKWGRGGGLPAGLRRGADALPVRGLP